MSNSSLLAIQKRLANMGIHPGDLDGLWGSMTAAAINAALDKLPIKLPEPITPPPLITGVVPMDWMPWCQMTRIIVHWTVGWYKASASDIKAYHLLIEGDGGLVRGKYSIKDNANANDGVYAPHVRGLNTGSIGISLCSMVRAKENPFDAGPAPFTRQQWDVLFVALADLCRRYGIPVTKQTVLTHAEVERTLGVKQAGKWDITRIPFDSSIKGAEAVGNSMRSAVAAIL